MTRISVAHRPDIVGGADRIVRVARTVQSITERSALIESGSLSPALSTA
jgi:hypothetical protein